MAVRTQEYRHNPIQLDKIKCKDIVWITRGYDNSHTILQIIDRAN